MTPQEERAFRARLTTVASEIEETLGALLPAEDGDAEAPLLAAMRYAALGGGKRLRGLTWTGRGRCGRPRRWNAFTLIP